MTIPGWVLGVLLLLGIATAAAPFANQYLGVLMAFMSPWIVTMLVTSTAEESPHD